MPVAVAAFAVVAAGCALGERPTLGEPADAAPGLPAAENPAATASTGVAEVDALLARLDATPAVTFAADYRVTRKLGPVTADARVEQLPPQLAVTVGDVRFIVGDGNDRTCAVSASTCEPGRLEQRISDLMIGSRFYAEGPAAALRVAMARRVADPEFTTREIAGLVADCVSVPVGDGADLTCVTPDGPLALLDTAAVTIEITSWSTAPDPAAFTDSNS
jgi:hypothetical protein